MPELLRSAGESCPAHLRFLSWVSPPQILYPVYYGVLTWTVKNGVVLCCSNIKALNSMLEVKTLYHTIK